ncbi:MAG: phosphoenolpyruvate--protein phosphotransferase, partial [Alphaproteobacteria bacterium]|nr:phosphoenolpyruvate--protein phosphotransferase [Alphaproteobacteria bacterium]
MTALVLMAPLDGWVSALEEVPDPVFSQRILGDGVAIDPTCATVRAPCDGVVISLAKHAVSLRAANGAEILIHVGLETVALHGQGFVSQTAEGRSVKTGDPLLRFDLDFVFERAKSLITPVVLTNGDRFEVVRRNSGRRVATGEFLMEIAPLAGRGATEQADRGHEAVRNVAVMLAHGIHARPAAVLANAARRFDSDIQLVRDTKRANAKSVVALMSLGIKHGEHAEIRAVGGDAQKAVATLCEIIAAGLGESPAKGAGAKPLQAARPEDSAAFAKTLRGVRAAPGMAVGRAFQLKPAEIPVAEEGAGIGHETAALDGALDKLRARLEASASGQDAARNGILGAHVALLDDPQLLDAARAAIGRGKSAAFAWRASLRDAAAALRAMDDALMRERARDLLDIEAQLIEALTGAAPPTLEVPPDAILLAEDFLPSQLIALGPDRVAGLCSAGGGPTSHVAILAAGLGLPALAGAGAGVTAIVDGTALILDADNAMLHISPEASELQEARAALALRATRGREAQARALEDCFTADGTRIEVFANLGSGAEEARAAVALGAEGCGLLRTEFLFQERDAAPSEDEQWRAYQAIAAALEGRPLIIRCFDIGGDKPVSYLPLPSEDNPALGLRGIRIGLWRPDLQRTQLAAILRVRPRPRVMLPMVVSLSELRSVRAMIEDLQRERGIEGSIALGVMVETPASAVLADQLASEADFLSIGTNDLTQYTLAMDRGHPQLASQIDALHPAVLRMIAQAAKGARLRAKNICLCGGLAA